MSPEEAYWIWLAQVQGLSHKRIEELLERFGSPQEVYRAGWERWASVVGVQLADRMRALRAQEAAEGLARTARDKGCQLITRAHPAYPETLRRMPDGPYLLYAQGDLSLLGRTAVAVVGSRSVTQYGRRAAAYFGAGLAAAGVCVVSGLARGVDSIAQQAALDAGGKVIAVLGTGLDRCYPPENQELQGRIAREGLLLSEHGFGAWAKPWHFPVRNRLLAGLSRAVLVVEASENSGSLITAGYAVDYDRELFAVPGSIFSPSSRGCNQLLRFSARPALELADLLSALDLPAVPQASGAQPRLPEGLSGEALALCTQLRGEDLSFDELVECTGLSPGKLNSLLTMLEMQGIIVKTPGRIYGLNGSFK